MPTEGEYKKTPTVLHVLMTLQHKSGEVEKKGSQDEIAGCVVAPDDNDKKSLLSQQQENERKKNAFFYYFQKGEKDTIPRKVITIKAQKDGRMEADTNNNRRKRNYKCIQLQHGTVILGKRATTTGVIPWKKKDLNV